MNAPDQSNLALDTDTHTPGAGGAPIYTPSPLGASNTQINAFTAALQRRTGRAFADYAALHAFSVQDYRTFWRCFVEWAEGLDYAGSLDPVCVADACEHASFFRNLELSYADNLLGSAIAPSSAPALTAYHADGKHVRLTRGALREQVARLAVALGQMGLRSGDRVVAVMRNDENAIVTALAVAALGATLSTASPEMGTEALIDRFGQLAPRLLFAHTAPLPFDAPPSLAQKVAALASVLLTLDGIVIVDGGPAPAGVAQPVHALPLLIAGADAARFVWARFSFNHPLFIMFSSGTTGRPKCIVHGAGGALIEHLKEHRLHSDLRATDKLYFHTSCAWMMWNWQLSALASGVEIVTYDGPLSSVDMLWRLVADERVTVFGTSPAYLKMCSDAGLEPARRFDLSALRAMMSTGAVLYDSQFQWVHDKVKPLPLQSISGGTDILGCFVLGHPGLPVHAGEAQCKSLALDVQAWENGKQAHGVGELVCTNPFPSRPLGFFGDEDGSRFHAAYFSANPGVWTHGDLIEFSAQRGARLHGRSDGVLNVRGVKVGPGEIYRILSDIDGIREAMVVQRQATASASTKERERRVVLLLVLQDGLTLTGTLIARVRRELARRASRAHVPDIVMQVDALPVTHSGKPSEAAARQAVDGLPVGNAGALRNPECLEAIRNHPALVSVVRELPGAGNTAEDLEHHLQALWERLFGYGPIGRDDNFFDLGGDSLLAAAMVTELQEATGTGTISLATLMNAPTIAQLAASLSSGVAATQSRTLVPMRAGTGTPVFWVHSIAGSVMECLRVVDALDSERPLYGLHARGLDGTETPLASVKEMAASYVDEIRTVQPHGPYSLVGYSFGGLIAFEMALQLHRAGEPIGLLCLIDSYIHERYLPWKDWLRHQLYVANSQRRKFVALPASERMRFVSRKLAVIADGVRIRLGHMPVQLDPAVEGLPPALQRVREGLRVAMVTYRPRPYHAGPIHYIRASARLDGHGDPLPLWKSVARRGLAIAGVSGGHVDMILEPHAGRIAETLDRVLKGEVPIVM